VGSCSSRGDVLGDGCASLRGGVACIPRLVSQRHFESDCLLEAFASGGREDFFCGIALAQFNVPSMDFASFAEICRSVQTS
jgi:hypothetical protein